ncbi:MAG: PQQ-binding-like beta-propeller repeat protein [Proteobacteria bacterium]|nr:PQQ-binding-like beta-propeller repeat protein [Pseudomonadota bacterium]
MASEDRHIYLLDAAGTQLWAYPSTDIFLDIAISADGSFVAAVDQGKKVHALNGETGDLLWQFSLPNVADTVAIYGTEKARVVAGTRDSQVHLLNTDGAELWRAQLQNSIKGVGAVKNGSKIVAATEAGDVVLLNGANTDVIWNVTLDENLNDVDITSDGSQIVVGGENGTFYVLDGASGAVQQTHDLESPVEAVAVSGDGHYFMTGTRGGQATYTDAATAASQFASQQRLQTGLTIGIPLALVILLIVFVIWMVKTASGQRFWNVRAAKPRQVGREMWKHRISYIFLIPTVSLLLVFNYYPAISGLVHSFTVWKPGVETRWVGLEQFNNIMHSTYFWVGIRNAVILVITGYIKVFTVPLLVAELLFALRNRGVQYGMRSLFIIPLVVPGVVGILVWVNIYDPNIGLLNQTLEALGLANLTRVWLGDAETALAAIIGIGFPWVSPFALLIFYGGLITIPQELFDAAKVDGATLWTRFWRIDVPLLMGQLKLLLILGFIGSIQEFQQIFLTTGGGPGNVTYTPALELYYQAVRFNNFGLASAMGAVLFLIILGGTTFYMRQVTSAIEYET